LYLLEDVCGDLKNAAGIETVTTAAVGMTTGAECTKGKEVKDPNGVRSEERKAGTMHYYMRL
jgi:hypothetical protein